MAISKINPNLCTGCELCVDDCPMDVLRMDQENGTAAIVYPEDCMTCYLCEEACAFGAVEVSPEATRKLFFAY